MAANLGERTASRILTLTVVMLLATLPVAAQAGIARLELVGLPEQVSKGDCFTVSVELTDVVDLYALDVHLSFDPDVLHVADQSQDQDGIQSTPGDMLSPDFVVRNTADNVSGEILMAMTQLNPREPVSGDGSALVIAFEAIAAGAPHAGVTAVTLAQRDGVKLPVDLGVWDMIAEMTPMEPPTLPVPTAVLTATATAFPTEAPPTEAPPTRAPPTRLSPTQVPTGVPTEVPTEVPTMAPTAALALTPAPAEVPEEAEPSGVSALMLSLATGSLAIVLWLLRKFRRST